jgi:hypothetical protein
MELSIKKNLQVGECCQHSWRTRWVVCIHLQQPQLGKRDIILVRVETPAFQHRVRVACR